MQSPWCRPMRHTLIVGLGWILLAPSAPYAADFMAAVQLISTSGQCRVKVDGVLSRNYRCQPFRSDTLTMERIVAGMCTAPPDSASFEKAVHGCGLPLLVFRNGLQVTID